MKTELNNTGVVLAGLSDMEVKLVIELYKLAGFELLKNKNTTADFIGVINGRIDHFVGEPARQLTLSQLAFGMELNPIWADRITVNTQDNKFYFENSSIYSVLDDPEFSEKNHDTEEDIKLILWQPIKAVCTSTEDFNNPPTPNRFLSYFDYPDTKHMRQVRPVVASELFKKGETVYKLNNDGTEAEVTSLDEIYDTGIYGVNVVTDPVDKPPVSSTEFLDHVKSIQTERGAEYNDTTGKPERSFNRVAEAYNAITGQNIKGSEVALLLQILKDVRQWANPSRTHMDSLIDSISYSALKAELIVNENSHDKS